MTNCARGLIKRLVRTQLPVVFFRPRGVAADVFCIPVTTRRGQRGDLEAASGLRAEGPHLRLHSVSVKAIANALLCLSPPPPPRPLSVRSLSVADVVVDGTERRQPRFSFFRRVFRARDRSKRRRVQWLCPRRRAAPLCVNVFRFPCRPSPPSLSVFPLIIISHNPYFAKRVGELEEILETSFFFFLRQRTKECQRGTRWCTTARLLTQNFVLRWRRVRNFSLVEI